MKKNILFVDDVYLCYAKIMHRLYNKNFKIYWANTKKEALKLIEKQEYEENKDKLMRLNYLNNEKEKQEGWINFHETSMKNHKKKILEASNSIEGKDQEKKLQFHIKEIENHHKRNIDYHNKELDFINKKEQLFKEGIKKCEEQLIYVNQKIKENQPT